MAPPEPHRRPLPRVFLERVSRALLARILSAHSEALVSRHAFPLALLAESAPRDRTHVDALWDLLSAPPPDLAALHDELSAVADVGSGPGHERLLANDAARVLDHELGDEDCAASAFLDHRALFDAARPQTAPAQTRSFASFESRTPRPFPDDPACDARFDGRMHDEIDARGRARYFKRHAWRSGHERHFELVYGRLASTRDVLGKTSDGAAHEITGRVTDRTTDRAYAVFHDDTLCLEVSGPDWFKELVRRVFGEAYFGSAEHFQGDETITLAPLLHLETALATHDVPGLKKVELQEAWIDLGDGSGWVAVGARNDCTTGAAGGYALRALSEGTPVEASFHLFTTVKTRPVTVKMVAPRKLDFDRRDPRVVRIVRDWVAAGGYMKVPVHARSDDAGSGVAEAGAGRPTESGGADDVALGGDRASATAAATDLDAKALGPVAEDAADVGRLDALR